MAPPTSQDMLKRNAEYCQTHDHIPTFEEMAHTNKQIATVAVITCADPRCIPEKFLKLEYLDAIVIRNAGSNVEEAMRSLLPIDQLVKFKEIMVINHTDCGATVYRDNNVRAMLKERAPNKADQVDKMTFGQITASSLEEQVRSNVQFLKESPFMRAELKQGITGYVYDVCTGALQHVV